MCLAVYLLLAVKAYLRKGQLHLAMKDTHRASEAYSKALELDPNCSVSGCHGNHVNLATLPANKPTFLLLPLPSPRLSSPLPPLHSPCLLKEARDGFQKCMAADDPEERRKKAMQDPEIQVGVVGGAAWAGQCGRWGS